MKLRVMTAVLACKLCRALIRLLGRGGTDFPGRVALKLCPNLLGELAKNVTTVIVTGTNGKTTTATLLYDLVRALGYKAGLVSTVVYKVGERIVFEDMIHYTMVKTTMFNGVAHPAIAIVRRDGAIEIIREFGYEDFKSRMS